MHMIDFSFNGKRLSDFGYMVAYLQTSHEMSISLGSELSFTTIRNPQTHTDKIVKSEYKNLDPVQFDIIKKYGEKFTDMEMSHLMRWLNVKKYKKFEPIYDDASCGGVYFCGSFNLSAISVGANIVGFTLTFTPNSPFGYTNDQTNIYEITSENKTFSFYNYSDELGYLYPVSYEITTLKKGDLTIENNMDKSKNTVIKNCKVDEMITIDCINKKISSDSLHTTLANDFNYVFPRFYNDENEIENVCTVSLPCTIKVTYSFPRKIGVIV